MNTNETQPEQTNTNLRIGALAQATNVAAKTIRFYEEVGLLPPARRAENGYRLYDQEDIRRLCFIRNARNLGISVDQLKGVLALRDQGQAPCYHVIDLLEQKALEIEERMRQLQMLQQDLQNLLRQAETLAMMMSR